MTLRRRLPEILAIAGLVAIALAVAATITARQHLTLPAWVPLAGDERLVVHAELEDGKSLVPGQGQTVTVAGVEVGEVTGVALRRGRAVVRLEIEPGKVRLHRDATAFVRPRTGLEDMVVELTVGTPGAGALRDGATLPITQTTSAVQVDQVLAALDADTRDRLVSLVTGGGRALGGDGGRQASRTLRRVEPLVADLRAINGALARRRAAVSGVVRRLGLLAGAVGERDADLAALVHGSDQVLGALARQDRALRRVVAGLPGALRTTRGSLTAVDDLAGELGPAARQLRPAARGLDEALETLAPAARRATPVLREQLRPFARDAQAPVRELRPAAGDLAALTPGLRTTAAVLERVFDTLAGDPAGADPAPLFYLAWANHLAASVFGTQDAHGPVRRGMLLTSCASLTVLEQIGTVNAGLGTLVALLDAPKLSEVCPAPGTTP
ncbi:MAG TPA: MlaD family protein [Baekduia sp.]|nr:MlaD family protein [Baekduia sp.]